jgi:hypothetical protein
MIYYDYNELEKDFMNGIITPQMLKASINRVMNEILDTCNERIQNNPETLEAYNYINELRLKKIQNKKRRKPNT